MLVQVDGRDMESVTAGLSREMNLLPEQLRRSLTWDRGMELADHKTVTKNTGLDVYFADPRSPWQRGHEREHESAAASVLSEGRQHEGPYSGRPRRCRRTAELEASENARLRHASR